MCLLGMFYSPNKLTSFNLIQTVSTKVALRWSRDSYVEALQGFANGIRTADGGSHLDGLKSAVTKTVNAFAKKVSV